MKSVLVVEGSPDLLRLFMEILPTVFPDWRMHGASNLRDADSAYRNSVFSLILLDMDFGDAISDSLALLRSWNATGRQCPVVATTTSRAALPRIWSENPAEVLLKPWEPFEIKPRLNRALASTLNVDDPPQRADGVALRRDFVFGGARITSDLLCRFSDGQVEKLGPKEYGILATFAECGGTLVTREKLLRAVWGADANSASNSVNVYVSRLRRMFEPHRVDFDALVVTEAKTGWRIAAHVDE